jgi:hypothetical protein
MAGGAAKAKRIADPQRTTKVPSARPRPESMVECDSRLFGGILGGVHFIWCGESATHGGAHLAHRRGSFIFCLH